MLGIGQIRKKRSHERIERTVGWHFYGQEQERRMPPQIKHEGGRRAAVFLAMEVNGYGWLRAVTVRIRDDLARASEWHPGEATAIVLGVKAEDFARGWLNAGKDRRGSQSNRRYLFAKQAPGNNNGVTSVGQENLLLQRHPWRERDDLPRKTKTARAQAMVIRSVITRQLVYSTVYFQANVKVAQGNLLVTGASK